EEKRMEEETVMLIGKTRKFKMVGHFPPTPSDPILRLIFPREVRPKDKTVVIRLSLPGIDFPDREAEFSVKDLMYRGKLEMWRAGCAGKVGRPKSECGVSDDAGASGMGERRLRQAGFIRTSDVGLRTSMITPSLPARRPLPSGPTAANGCAVRWRRRWH